MYDLQPHPHGNDLMDPTVSLHFLQHHDTYATILIVPAERDSLLMYVQFDMDNSRRQRAITRGEQDPGRGNVDWFEVKFGSFHHINVY